MNSPLAQQEAERAKYVVEQAKQDKKSTIIRAEGEATSARLIGEAMENNPGFIELRRINVGFIGGSFMDRPRRILPLPFLDRIIVCI